MRLEDSEYKQLYAWWQYLHDKYENEADQGPSNRAARARLRRCKNLTEICFEQAYVNLRQQFPNMDAQHMAVIAGLLAHCKEIKLMSSNERDYFAKQMAGLECENVPVKSLRFQRLLNARTPSELYLQLLRIIAIVRKPIDLRSLIDGICNWGDELKQAWAYAYYSVLSTNKE